MLSHYLNNYHPALERPRVTNQALYNEIAPGHNEGPIR